ncbi:phenylacetic acid degradation operon negative regulatory protein PaaX [Shinella sp. CPCC 101442]|uniref:phenylacetic acid degradation operon negative regulatory protein PaaX n=1 Tax=Shinella sp. CPCC 101442 TaxID=2932265 RepID=UPI002152B4E6|nr:phenylacetic acid degradation operon negative regulatory protein PaaX [Shinella sp. CPCC 101442]MCR6502223.1 phenylacetic acid degradation operon negative regulatory protein PaaX [Shinella sp. CPCC 101442]
MPSEQDRPESAFGALIKAIIEESPLKAAGFIVTIYGDVVEPRGGVVWTGNLIDTCADVGISETLVRTAVSRLVAAGQVSGEREGRRSFYRLAAPARTEFAAAARMLFGPPEVADWHFVQLTGAAPDEAMQALERAGHARLGPRLAVGARPMPSLKQPAVLFRAEVVSGEGDLGAFAADHWNLAQHADAYRGFIQRFGRLADLLGGGVRLAAAESLAARLVLVHQFRLVVLRDPRLPQAALPADWPGEEARRLFNDLYLRLSPEADLHVARHFVTADGALPEASEATLRRLSLLRDAI